MDKQGQEYQWLEWAKELQFIAQAGLTYTKDLFDKERFERIREISAEIMSLQSKHPLSEIKDLFCNETGFRHPNSIPARPFLRIIRFCWWKKMTAHGPCLADG